jgi:hypothetical protein
MAPPPDVIVDGSQKSAQENSVTAVPKTYELDGIYHDEDEYHGLKSPGFTKMDRRDMDRMGKTQELRVS